MRYIATNYYIYCIGIFVFLIIKNICISKYRLDRRYSSSTRDLNEITDVDLLSTAVNLSERYGFFFIFGHDTVANCTWLYSCKDVARYLFTFKVFHL